MVFVLCTQSYGEYVWESFKKLLCNVTKHDMHIVFLNFPLSKRAVKWQPQYVILQTLVHAKQLFSFQSCHQSTEQ